MITKELAKFLDANGFGEFDETGMTGDIFINILPAEPDEAVAIYSTGGSTPDPKNIYGHPTIQLIIRSIPNDPRDAETKARAIVDKLNGFDSGYLTDGGHYVVNVEAVQDGPNNIGQDPNSRYEFSQNFNFEYMK